MASSRFDGEGEARHLAATAEEPRALDARNAGADGFGVQLLGDDGLGQVRRERLEVAREVGPAFGGGRVDDEALLGELTLELVFPDSILEVDVVAIEGVGEDGDLGRGDVDAELVAMKGLVEGHPAVYLGTRAPPE